ncbi:MAG: hypothetical protein WBE26_06015 [Phycisphaerae bacterium]
MAKRSAAMRRGCLLAVLNMPAPVFDGLVHPPGEDREGILGPATCMAAPGCAGT